eukprot:scaffold58420_cov21-Tisochrysis_lutea.AAC.1
MWQQLMDKSWRYCSWVSSSSSAHGYAVAAHGEALALVATAPVTTTMVKPSFVLTRITYRH